MIHFSTPVVLDTLHLFVGNIFWLLSFFFFCWHWTFHNNLCMKENERTIRNDWPCNRNQDTHILVERVFNRLEKCERGSSTMLQMDFMNRKWNIYRRNELNNAKQYESFSSSPFQRKWERCGLWSENNFMYSLYLKRKEKNRKIKNSSSRLCCCCCCTLTLIK